MLLLEILFITCINERFGDIFRKHLMIVYAGISDTKNALTTEVGGYEHVVVLRDIGVVDGDLVEALQHLPRGSFAGDCIL